MQFSDQATVCRSCRGTGKFAAGFVVDDCDNCQGFGLVEPQQLANADPRGTYFIKYRDIDPPDGDTIMMRDIRVAGFSMIYARRAVGVPVGAGTVEFLAGVTEAQANAAAALFQRLSWVQGRKYFAERMV